MHDLNIKRPDLNLLLVFDAVARHGSVSAAARELSLSQPAISHALARLRGQLNDALFVRGQRGLKLTPFAESIAPSVRSNIQAMSDVFQHTAFDPAVSARPFTVGVTDYALITVVPALTRYLRAHAPRVSLQLRTLDERVTTALETGEMDCAFWGVAPPHKTLRSRVLTQEGFIGVVWSQHPLAAKAAAGTLSLDDYLAYPHSEVHFNQVGPGPVDKALAERGLARHIVISAPSFANNLACLIGTDLIATAPARLMVNPPFSDLQTFALPFAMPFKTYPYLLIWHDRTDTDQGNIWLRQVIADLIAAEPKDLDRR